MIEIYEFKKMDLRGATIIDGFPSAGLISVITANYLIGTLNLDQICAMDSPDFPPNSMVYASKPNFPVRMYGDEKNKLVVFISEFAPPPMLVRPIADAILSWAKDHKCARIISPEGIPIQEYGVSDNKKDCCIYGVGSNTHARANLDEFGVKQLETGIVSGVSAILLNEGMRRDFDEIGLLPEVNPNIPDVRAAAKVMETINKFIPKVYLDPEPLYKEAARIEEYMWGQNGSEGPVESAASPLMYG